MAFRYPEISNRVGVGAKRRPGGVKSPPFRLRILNLELLFRYHQDTEFRDLQPQSPLIILPTEH